MKLASAQAGQVVRNVKNGSHYRFERLERGKVRIWPLELFPNGRLIVKPTPTLVEADIEVVFIAPWSDDLVVEGKPSKSRAVYERQLIARERELLELRAEYDRLPKSGKGHASRGSFANKVKSAEIRVRTLKLGLGFTGRKAVHEPTVPLDSSYQPGEVVQVPSGRMAVIVSFAPMGDTIYAMIRMRIRGSIVETGVPYEILRPQSQSRLCTV